MRKKAAEAASLITGIDRLALATQQSAPPASAGLAKLRSWLTLKPSKNNPGGLYWRLAEIHNAPGETNASASVNASISRHTGLTKTGSRAYQISADALKAADQVDKDLKPAVAALWARNDKPSALSLDNFRKEAVAGLKKVGGLMGQGVEAQGKAQARHLLAMAAESPSTKDCADEDPRVVANCLPDFNAGVSKCGGFGNWGPCHDKVHAAYEGCKKRCGQPDAKPPAKPPAPKPPVKPLSPARRTEILRFVSAREGGQKLVGYVPDPKGSKSGVTIATGFDLGQRSPQDIDKLAISPALKKKLKPFTGIKGQKAVAVAKNLKLTQTEADELDGAVKGPTLTAAINRYNAATRGSKFEELPYEAQAVVASVSFQYGDLSKPKTGQKFWKAVTEQRWTDAEKELRNFGDKYPTRRKTEADLLQKAIKRGDLK